MKEGHTPDSGNGTSVERGRAGEGTKAVGPLYRARRPYLAYATAAVVGLMLSARFIMGLMVSFGYLASTSKLERSLKKLEAEVKTGERVPGAGDVKPYMYSYMGATLLFKAVDCRLRPFDSQYLDTNDPVRAKRLASAARLLNEVLIRASQRDFSLPGTGLRPGIEWNRCASSHNWSHGPVQMVKWRLDSPLLAESMVAGRRGDWKRAFECCRAMMRLSEYQQSDHVLIDSLCALATLRRAIWRLDSISEHWRNVPEKEISKTLLAMKQRNTVNDIRLSIRMDCVAFASELLKNLEESRCRPLAWLMSFDDAFIGDGCYGDVGMLDRLVLWYIRPILVNDLACFADKTARLLDELSRAGSYSELMGVARKYSRVERSPLHLLSAYGIPNYEKIFQKAFETRKQKQAAMIGLAAELVRRRTGRLPGSLDDIPQDLLPAGCRVDPMTGKPYDAVVRNGVLVVAK